MGNRLTRCDAPSPPPPADGSSAEENRISDAFKKVSSVNPGQWDMFSMDAKRYCALDTYDGVRVEINKQLSPFMLINHNFWLGTTMLQDSNKTYQFSAQVGSEDGVLIGRCDHKLGVEGQIIRQRQNENFTTTNKVVVVVSPEKSGGNDQLMLSSELSGPSWCMAVKAGSMAGGNAFGLNYVQSVTSDLAVGADAFYLGSKNLGLTSGGLRYSSPNKKWMASGQWSGMQQAFAGYYKRTVTKDRVNLAAELTVNPASLESSTTVGAEFQLRQGRVAMCLGGDGRIRSVLETKLNPGVTMNFSAEVNHFTDTYKFGYGINMM